VGLPSSSRSGYRYFFCIRDSGYTVTTWLFGIGMSSICKSSGLTDTARLAEAYGKNRMLWRLEVLIAVLMGIWVIQDVMLGEVLLVLLKGCVTLMFSSNQFCDWWSTPYEFCSVRMFTIIMSCLQAITLRAHSSLLTCSMVPAKVMGQAQGGSRTPRLITWALGSTRAGRCPITCLSFRIR